MISIATPFLLLAIMIHFVSPTYRSLITEPGEQNLTVLDAKSRQIKSENLSSRQNGTNTTTNTPVLTKSDESHQNVSQVYQFPQLTFETWEDRKTQEEWGGNCTLAYWDKCKVIETWFATPIMPIISKNGTEEVDTEVDCKLEPVLCMYNGWTVNRCHILCMGECNKEMMYRFDKYVSHEGECKAHGHG